MFVGFYFINMLLAFSFANKLIFQPQPSSYRDHSEIIKLTTANGERISARFFQNPAAEHTILFSHGNAEDLGTAAFFLEELRKAGFAVFAYDYRGYGTSEGKPSEENAYQDAQAAYTYLTDEFKIPPEKIIAHGRSLGGAVALDLATRKKCGGLIVESSFVSAFRVVTKYPIFPFDKFQNLQKISRVKCPVLFIHGKKDSLIPFWHAEQLFNKANEPKFSLWFNDGEHNNIYSIGKKAYLEKIRDFAGNLPK
ncbi:MAG TPA: alpha/beta hydrolase [Pyrinomonadaceae bacterium]